MPPPPTDVSYVTVRRPFPKPLDIPDYELQLYQQLAPGVSSADVEAHLTDDAIFGIFVVDDAFEHSARQWFIGKAERFGWDATWHDSLDVAEADLAARVAAER